MNNQSWHKVILAYRLEDEYGNSPFYYDGHRVILPVGYYGAYISPDRYISPEYDTLVYKHFLYEYVLNITAKVYMTGEVLFRKDDIRSKSVIRRWAS